MSTIQSSLGARALSALRSPARRGSPDVIAAELEPLDGGASGSTLYRLRCRLAHGADWSCILKEMTPLEYGVHALLCQHVGGAVPDLLASWPVPHDQTRTIEAGRFVLMEDVNSDRHPGSQVRIQLGTDTFNVRMPAAGATSFAGALRTLARVHDRFFNDTRDLERCGVGPVPLDPKALTESASEVCRTLALCIQDLELVIDRNALEEVTRIVAGIAAHVTPLQHVRSLTLAHGDFHLGNIAVGHDGSVKILDWGAAALHVPAWDLVTYGEAEVEHYVVALESFRSHFAGDTRFFRELKACVMCRMFFFLRAALALFLPQRAAAAANALSICVGRLIEAASSSSFRGGRGVRLAARPSGVDAN
jgi:hypothetical protein